MRKISADLRKKLHSQNQTTAYKSSPSLQVIVARARSSISDTNYFITEVIREKEGISDIAIAVQRTKLQDRPTGIFEIHLDNGIAKTTTRAYPDVLKEGWKHAFDIGPATSVAIAFDGRWHRSKKKDRWIFVSLEKPWIFWNDDGVLHSRIWDDVSTHNSLADSVVKVTALRGWKSNYVKTHDQGIICAYIKTDGKVYYRNYCEQADGRFIWEQEKQLTPFTGHAQNIKLFLTNDYRTGFLVEDINGNISWYITHRCWSGMAIPPETLSSGPTKVECDLIPVTYKDNVIHEKLTVCSAVVDSYLGYTLTDNRFYDIQNHEDPEGEWGKILTFRTQHRLYNIHAGDFQITDQYSRTYTANSIEEIGTRTYRLEFEDFNDVDKQGTLHFLGLHTTNYIDLAYEPFSSVFYPKNLVPQFTPRPVVEVIYNV